MSVYFYIISRLSDNRGSTESYIVQMNSGKPYYFSTFIKIVNIIGKPY